MEEESVLIVKPPEEEFTLYISSSSPSSSPPSSPPSADPAAVITVDIVDDVVSPPSSPPASSDPAVVTVDFVAAVSSDRVSDAPVTVEETLEEEEEEEFQIDDANVTVETLEEILEKEFRTLVLEDIINKDNNGEEEEEDDDLKKEEEEEEDDDLVEEVYSLDLLREEEKPRRRILYPQRPDAPDCSFYLRTGSCRYGSNCRYNHPARKENQARRSASPESAQVIREKEKEDFSEKMGQQECKYYLRSGGCKFGKACRYNHSWEKPVLPSPPIDFNFLGLPIRLGERECPYYMRTGSCKYGPNCRFHHPDPTAAGGGDIPSGSVSLHPSGASQPASTSWSSPPNETVPYLDAASPYVPMMLPSQGVHPNPEWNGYQAPAYPPERSIHPPSGLSLNNPINRTDVSMYNQQRMLDEFPERPGQPECSYFMKTGDCKYRSACKYNHPKNRAPKSSACMLSPMGLPLRPDQSICTHYHRYGICKFGAACKFDHPVNYAF